MTLLLTILLVLIILVLCMWAVWYLPMPPGSPTWIKNFVYVLLLIVAIVVIVHQAGLLHA